MQTQQEINRVLAVWEAKYIPADLINNAANGKAIAAHCMEVYGFVSIANINATVADLRAEGKLELVAPKQMTQAEQQKALRERAERLAAKDLADQIRADADNRKDIREKAAEVKAKEEAAKKLSKEQQEEATAKTYVEQKIMSWTVNGKRPGSIDFTESEKGQNLLREVRVLVNGKVSWKLTAKIIGNVFNTDSVGALRTAIADEYAHINEPTEKPSQMELDARRGVGAAATLPRYSR